MLKEMGIPDHFTCLLRTCTQVKKQQLEPVMEQQTDSKLGTPQTRVPTLLFYAFTYTSDFTPPILEKELTCSSS